MKKPLRGQTLMGRVNSLYKEIDNKGVCAYCGSRGAYMDHFIPLFAAMRLAYKGLDKLEPYKSGLCLIPVCPSCNTIVNKYIFKDIEDKSTFVKRSITRKIEKHLCGSKIDHDWLNSFNKRLFWEVKNNPNWEELSRISIPVLIAPVR